MSALHGRRASDGQSPDTNRPTPLAPLALLKHAREWMPAAIGLLAFVGAQVQSPGSRFAAIEHEQRVGVVRDSLSIEDRVSITEALTTLGRIECRRLGSDEATDRGVPCAVLGQGRRWPLLHGPQRTSAAVASIALAVADGVPPLAPFAPSPLEHALLAALFIPAATLPPQ
ncbi:hypothetical protein J421_4655 (plasmid) [Gemmatirosa kalamazoonensis]|uniref:Uncharacterized protein n=1 Tax=Gemmatirosa kalamazoonensis TaxID=861299 RepID=W0RNQ1_9BACT|nr:hypothetical protein [Gemmatirosa kalamazoonensis]AHG92122.1 hypothetical protein J421_4587 [Gemmatirosa kalamazoonensis]AHG92190.1 hypothetical protein J421_4655 [Gemmatirosa kalamazoonensis]